MPNFINNRSGQSLATTLAPRSKRSDSGQVHSLWQGVSVPNAPTSLAVTAKSSTTATFSFTPPSDNGGSEITNYAFSTNGTSFTLLSPADATSPVTVTGLTLGTSYTLYLAAVNSAGVGAPSAGISFSLTTDATGGTINTYSSGGFNFKSHRFTSTGTFTVTSILSDIAADIWIVSGGGGGGADRPAGGGGGGAKTVTGIALNAQAYTITIGGTGALGAQFSRGSNGGNSSGLGQSTSGGGAGGGNNYVGANGGSGGGNQGVGVSGEGNNGGTNNSDDGAGGGGKGGNGANGFPVGSGNGGAAGTNNYEDGTNRSYAAGGSGGFGTSPASEYGRGGKGGNNSGIQAGVVIIRYRV
jgi:hypothetical protein